MVIKKNFEVLRYLEEHTGELTQRIIAEDLKISLENVDLILGNLMQEGLITASYRLTEEGEEQLAPYKVNNAIVLAAGMSTRFVPFSYEKPKGLTVVKGEVLIERQIKQLREAGVDEIILVLGHMMEKFFYLVEKYQVKIVVNNEYRFKNTHSSLYFARDYLRNTYICCADNYFPKNVFHKYEYRSIYSTEYMSGIWRGERGVVCDKNGLIIQTQRPAIDQWVMNGYAYFNQEFSMQFKIILEEMYDLPGTNDLYWEQVYAEHVDELHLYEIRYEDGLVYEFDSVADLEAFDPDYIKYNDLQLIRNICSVLNCTTSDIHEIKPIKKGYTNKSFSFWCRDRKYVYRNPGKISTMFINRQTEKKALTTAKEIGIDDSYIYENEKEGWKISNYVDVTEAFDFSKENHLEMLCGVYKKLFKESLTCGRLFDYLYEAKLFLEKIKEIDMESYKAAIDVLGEIEQIDREIKGDGWPLQLTHNDVYEDNLLIAGKKLYLIDWEFAGDTDMGFDLCKLFVKNNAVGKDIDRYLSVYYGRNPTYEERRHVVGCAAVSFYYWYVWALYMVKNGNDYSELMLKYFSVMLLYLTEYQKMKKG